MSEYNEIKSRLAGRKKELESLLHRVEKSARRKLDKDFEEQAIQRENEEVLTSLDESLNEELKQVDKALGRIEQGDYGNCEQCGGKISDKRLEIVPHAVLCINCAA